MIPLPTTTITLLAPIEPPDPGADVEADDWGVGADPETGYEPVAFGIRAHLSNRVNVTQPSAFGQFTSAGNTEQLKYRLIADVCELKADMRVRDERTGLEYDVAWVVPRPPPMPHMVASLTKSVGVP